jgi:glycosyltransferase involved in cell wall biosynthesis
MNTLPSADGRPDTAGHAPKIAILIPCFNEEVAFDKVIRDFRAQVPDAAIYVYDNNSTDNTLAIAAAAGAICRRESLQRKGNVIRRMFADVYVLLNRVSRYARKNSGKK